MKSRNIFVIIIFIIAMSLAWVLWPRERFIGEMLTYSIYFLLLSLSSLLFLAIHFLSGTKWWQYFQVIPVSMTHPLIPSVLIVILIVAGINNDSFHFIPDGSEEGTFKEKYLSGSFFIIRNLIILIAWILIARSCTEKIRKAFLYATSSAIKNAKSYSAVFVIIFALFISFLTWDWIISLYPGFISTLFSWFVFTGGFSSAIAAIIIFKYLFIKAGRLTYIEEKQYLNLGKYLFVFSVFWVYLWYSQYMLIWYGNLPEGSQFFLMQKEKFGFLFHLNVILNFTIPFLVLLSPFTKKNPGILFIVAIVVILGQILNLYISIMPAFLNSASGLSPLSFLLVMTFFLVYYIQIEHSYNQYTKRKISFG